MEIIVRIVEHIWNELKAEEDEIAPDKVLIFQIEKKTRLIEILIQYSQN